MLVSEIVAKAKRICLAVAFAGYPGVLPGLIGRTKATLVTLKYVNAFSVSLRRPQAPPPTVERVEDMLDLRRI